MSYILILYYVRISLLFFFFFNDPATTEIYPLPLHDALPIFPVSPRWRKLSPEAQRVAAEPIAPAYSPIVLAGLVDRKSTRLNSSHSQISYAVFCLKKKKQK